MNKKYSGERRNFLKTLAVIGGAAVSFSTVTAKTGTLHRPSSQAEEKQLSGGYTETVHIRKYYKTAQI